MGGRTCSGMRGHGLRETIASCLVSNVWHKVIHPITQDHQVCKKIALALFITDVVGVEGAIRTYTLRWFETATAVSEIDLLSYMYRVAYQ